MKYMIMAILTVGWFGFLGPAMVSADNDVTPASFIIVTLLGITYIVNKWIIPMLKDNDGKWRNFMLLFICVGMMGMTACSKVPAGNVGVKFYALGGNKGVDHEVLTPGRYYIGMNEYLYLFPTFTQNIVWTKNPAEGSENDESITFQTSGGLGVTADIGLTYHIEPDKVPSIFEKYKKGIGEITDVFMRNMVRDAFVLAASTKKVQSVYGTGKSKLLEEVDSIVKVQTEPLGIIIDKIYIIGKMELPQSVVNAIDAKINATQKAELRENQLREAEAQAKKSVALAQGKGDSILVVTKAEAEANILLSKSITPTLVKYKTIDRWNGVVSMYSGGGSGLMFNMGK